MAPRKTGKIDNQKLQDAFQFMIACCMRKRFLQSHETGPRRSAEFKDEQ